MELVTTEHHTAARNLYASRGFEFLSAHTKTYVAWGLLTLTLYRLRVACSTLHAMKQQQSKGDITDSDVLNVD